MTIERGGLPSLFLRDAWSDECNRAFIVALRRAFGGTAVSFLYPEAQLLLVTLGDFLGDVLA
jgi:hypothetical protein